MDGRIERGGSGIWRAKGGVVRRKTGKTGFGSRHVNNGPHREQWTSSIEVETSPRETNE